MSPHKENDLLYLLNILEYSGKIWKYTENITSAEALYEFIKTRDKTYLH